MNPPTILHTPTLTPVEWVQHVRLFPEDAYSLPLRRQLHAQIRAAAPAIWYGGYSLHWDVSAIPNGDASHLLAVAEEVYPDHALFDWMQPATEKERLRARFMIEAAKAALNGDDLLSNAYHDAQRQFLELAPEWFGRLPGEAGGDRPALYPRFEFRGRGGKHLCLTSVELLYDQPWFATVEDIELNDLSLGQPMPHEQFTLDEERRQADWTRIQPWSVVDMARLLHLVHEVDRSLKEWPPDRRVEECLVNTILNIIE